MPLWGMAVHPDPGFEGFGRWVWRSLVCASISETKSQRLKSSQLDIMHPKAFEPAKRQRTRLKVDSTNTLNTVVVSIDTLTADADAPAPGQQH